MPISVLENAVSNAERRTLLHDESAVVPRLADVYAALPAITGKIELEYEGELVGAAKIARELIARSAAETLAAWGGEAVEESLEEVVAYFEGGGVLQLADDASAAACLEGFGTVPGLLAAVEGLGLARGATPGHTAAACELVLEALVGERRISRSDAGRYGRAPRRPGKGPGPIPPMMG
jgi:magnesium chelatase subunit I